jgi:hypothetical protein
MLYASTYLQFYTCMVKHGCGQDDVKEIPLQNNRETAIQLLGRQASRAAIEDLVLYSFDRRQL